MNEVAFATWESLKNPAGLMAAVLIFTQLTKGVKLISTWPTQLWSYALAVMLLELATLFTEGFNLSATILVLINAGIASLAANGSHEMIQRVSGGQSNGQK